MGGLAYSRPTSAADNLVRARFLGTLFSGRLHQSSAMILKRLMDDILAEPGVDCACGEVGVVEDLPYEVKVAAGLGKPAADGAAEIV